MSETELSGEWRLCADSAQPSARLAAAELEQGLHSLGGPALHLRSDGDEAVPAIVLEHDDRPGDGFTREIAPGRVRLRGESARGLLYAVFDLLEELGGGWPWPEEQAPATPRRLRLACGHVVQAPHVPGRCLILGNRAFLAEAERWIVWAARNRLNRLFIHVGPEIDPVGAAPEHQWRERREALIPLARERGMAIEHGGHLLDALVAPDDVCAGDDDDLARLRQAAERHARAHSEADVLHVWRAESGGHRGCGHCRHLSPSDRALVLANTVAEGAAAARSGVVVSCLAYRDTLPVARQVEARPDVCLLWAPRERCYQHGAGDPGCATNMRLAETLHAQVERFRAAGAAPLQVFEYYLDAIRFPSGIPDLVQVVREDVRFYSAAGAHTLQALMTGLGPWPKPHPNAAGFARAAWDPSS